MSEMGLLPEDFTSQGWEEVDLFYQDLFKKKSVLETIKQDCAPEIVFAVQLLQNWQKENNITVCDHKEAKDKVLSLITKKQVPETVEIPVVRSLWSFWGLYCELDCIPGRPLEGIVAIFKQDYPGVPTLMLGEVVRQNYPELRLTDSAFEMRDWCRANPRPADKEEQIRWNFRFGCQAEEIRKKYDLPEYLE